VGISTLLRFLIGDRSAILAIAVQPRAWVTGLVFVLSAGFAREYDSEDLLHEPWYLLVPLAASLGSSFLLFGVLYGVTALRETSGPSFPRAYRAFLTLFWFTAPLAWLYAIPYERFLDAVAATRANLYTLALVSAWRVALMMRVAVVLMGMRPLAAFSRVLAYSSGLALVAINFLPFPIIEIMGGVHVTGADRVVQSAAQLVGCFGPLLFVVCLVLALGIRPRPHWQVSLDSHVQQATLSIPLKLLACASLATWIGILPLTQAEQRLRRRVEVAFRDGQLADALDLMSAHEPEEFPPQWEPPPRFLKGEDPALVLDVWVEMLKKKPAPWVQGRYMARIKNYLRSGHGDDEKTASMINRLPGKPALLQQLARDPQWQWYLERLDSHLRPELRINKNGG